MVECWWTWWWRRWYGYGVSVVVYPKPPDIDGKEVRPWRRRRRQSLAEFTFRRNVEQWTIARLPLFTTQVTELGGAAASHVVTSLAQLNHGSTSVAALPALFLAHVNNQLCVDVVFAVSASVPA
jgi:hypothetical protein